MSWLSQGYDEASGAVGDALGGISGPNKYHADVQNPYQDADRQRQVGSIDEGAGANTAAIQGQQALIAALQAQANGQGPSLAQMQLQQATDRNMQQAAGLQAMQRGVSPGLAARQLQQNQASMQQQAAGQSGIQRLEEQRSAQAMLGQALGQARGQDLGQMQAGEQANLGNKGLGVQAGLGNAQINAGVAGSNTGFWGNLIGGALNAAGGIGAAAAKGGAGGAVVGAAKGGVVPGPDHGYDTQPAMLRGQEVVVPPESPMYKAALLDALKRGTASPAAVPRATLIDALRGAFAPAPPWAAPQATPGYSAGVGG